eukprot:6214310-Pleurochrysis_carterae.AAC.1
MPAQSTADIDEALIGDPPFLADVSELLQPSRFVRLGEEVEAMSSEGDGSSSDEDSISAKSSQPAHTLTAATASSLAPTEAVNGCRQQSTAQTPSKVIPEDEVQHMARHVHRTRLRAERMWTEKGTSEVRVSHWPYPTCTGRIPFALAVSLLHWPYPTHLHWPYPTCTGRIPLALAVSHLHWPYPTCNGRVPLVLAVSHLLSPTGCQTPPLGGPRGRYLPRAIEG